MVNDNDFVTLRKDKKFQTLLAIVKDRQPLSVLKHSAPYVKDTSGLDSVFHYQPMESYNLRMVRERLINDQPLVLCETANWNHETQQTKDYYLDTYMAKNLYYFVCKKISRFNSESIYRENSPKGDVRLIPTGFVNDNWKCDTTTDPEVFWAKP